MRIAEYQGKTSFEVCTQVTLYAHAMYAMYAYIAYYGMK